ncbi:DUF2797 domain-containing protein [Marinobacter bryozoorum]|nr:DUF2797 domain-containing protein [Marinobacter bryozoorum]MCK7545126.1 DUF2797 domain-containing protein [Marinobacter bryozoorum]
MNQLHEASGRLVKMPATPGQPVSYRLRVGDSELPLNEMLGQTIEISYSGEIRCIHCNRKTNKSFSQGYCYPCFKRLAACDTCIMSPEKCHYHLGTCREPEWGETHCMTVHVVYLANSSGLKVGITRASQVPTRWIDQGAVAAIPMLRVATRYLAGLVEVACKQHVADRTNWRTMLKGEAPALDLVAERAGLLERIGPDLDRLAAEHGQGSIEMADDPAWHLDYPVDTWPQKIKTHNLDKEPVATGVLQGIKGQYLMLDTGVINIRKYTAYDVRVRVLSE